MSFRLAFPLVLGIIASTSIPASAGLLTGNAGFETAGLNATDSALWSEFADTNAVSERDSTMPLVGSYAHHLMATGATGLGASAGINQNSIADVGLPSLQEGTSVSAEFQWKGSLGTGGVAFAVLRILNGVGAIVADTGLQPLPNTGGSYTLQSLPMLNVPAFGGGPNDTYAAFLEISVGAGAFVGSTAEGFVDSVNVSGTTVPVPEPSPLALLGLIGLVTIAGRRWKRNRTL